MTTRLTQTIALSLALAIPDAWAGGDAWGQIQRVQIAADGKLWFAMGTPPATTYCKEGWAGMNLFVPKDHPEYPYYYAMLLTAVSRGKTVLVPTWTPSTARASAASPRPGMGWS